MTPFTFFDSAFGWPLASLHEEDWLELLRGARDNRYAIDTPEGYLPYAPNPKVKMILRSLDNSQFRQMHTSLRNAGRYMEENMARGEVYALKYHANF